MYHKDTEFRDDHTPLAFLIAFGCYGTWLHGDKRGAVDRYHNRYGTPRIPRNDQWRDYNRRMLKYPPAKLNSRRRKAVAEAIRETCSFRKWSLWVQSVRTNHVHAVVTAHCDPERVLNAFKANATRKMRESGCLGNGKPWAEGGSKKRLWTEKDVIEAIVYVEYEQGEPLP